MVQDTVVYAVLSVSCSLNVVFLRRLLKKVDNISLALFDSHEGALIRIDRLENTMERRRPHPRGV